MREEAHPVAGGNRGAADDLGKIDAAHDSRFDIATQDVASRGVQAATACVALIPSLAEQIEAEHQASIGAICAALQHAAECGRLLIEAQTECSGNWGQWVEANLTFGQRQAQKYAQFARAVRVKPELLNSHSTLDGALSAIADNSPLKHPLPYGSHSGHVEWYTAPPYLERARQVLGGFDVDPASSDIAQKQVRALDYFTAENGGLDQPWNGRVWVNPPYSNAGKWVDKLLTELSAGRTTSAMLLVNGYTDSKWFHRAAAKCAAICFPQGRVHFLKPDGEPGQPAYGSAFFYFGDQVDRFREAFAGLGTIMLPDRAGDAA